MAAGKSTLAQKLSIKFNAILLVEDDWLASLYPDEIKTIHEYVNYSSRLKNLLSKHIVSLLCSGLSVVLDFPANTQEQRKWFRSIIEQANTHHVMHYVDKSDDICKQQLKIRNKNKADGAAFTSDEEFEKITQYFQVPNESEGFNILKYV